MDQSPVQSPTPIKEKPPKPSGAMEFPDALREVISGKAITKVEWSDPAIQVKIINELLMIKTDDGMWHPLKLSYGDMTGDDWIVV